MFHVLCCRYAWVVRTASWNKPVWEFVTKLNFVERNLRGHHLLSDSRFHPFLWSSFWCNILNFFDVLPLLVLLRLGHMCTGTVMFFVFLFQREKLQKRPKMGNESGWLWKAELEHPCEDLILKQKDFHLLWVTKRKMQRYVKLHWKTISTFILFMELQERNCQFPLPRGTPSATTTRTGRN